MLFRRTTASIWSDMKASSAAHAKGAACARAHAPAAAGTRRGSKTMKSPASAPGSGTPAA
jgi:hypothetical protein